MPSSRRSGTNFRNSTWQATRSGITSRPHLLLAQPGVAVEEIETHNESRETWRQLSVIFPPGIPTHSARQTFYFNDKGLLQRLDYATDVAGGVASSLLL